MVPSQPENWTLGTCKDWVGSPQDSDIKSKKKCQGQLGNLKEDFLGFPMPASSPEGLRGTGPSVLCPVRRGWRSPAPSGPALLRTLQSTHWSFFPAAVFHPLPPWCPCSVQGLNATIYGALGTPGISPFLPWVQSPRRPNGGLLLPGRDCGAPPGCPRAFLQAPSPTLPTHPSSPVTLLRSLRTPPSHSTPGGGSTCSPPLVRKGVF